GWTLPMSASGTLAVPVIDPKSESYRDIRGRRRFSELSQPRLSALELKLLEFGLPPENKSEVARKAKEKKFRAKERISRCAQTADVQPQTVSATDEQLRHDDLAETKTNSEKQNQTDSSYDLSEESDTDDDEEEGDHEHDEKQNNG